MKHPNNEKDNAIIVASERTMSRVKLLLSQCPHLQCAQQMLNDFIVLTMIETVFAQELNQCQNPESGNTTNATRD